MKKLAFCIVITSMIIPLAAAAIQSMPTREVIIHDLPTTPITVQYVLCSIIKHATSNTDEQAQCTVKYLPLINAALASLKETNVSAYDDLMTPIIECCAGTIDVNQAQAKIDYTLSHGILAYQIYIDLQQRYAQEIETSVKVVTNINTALDAHYQRMHLQLFLSTIAAGVSTLATICVGYLQISKLFGYKAWPFAKAHKILATTHPTF